MSNKSYIKEAEQNVINQAKFWTEFVELIDSMRYSIYNKLDSHKSKEKFEEGLSLLRVAAWEEQQFALARCFCISGVGGKESEDFSKEQANRIFGGKYSSIQWLDKWNRVPSSWLVKDEESFRKELDDKLGVKHE